jgi:hypothetical protein
VAQGVGPAFKPQYCKKEKIKLVTLKKGHMSILRYVVFGLSNLFVLKFKSSSLFGSSSSIAMNKKKAPQNVNKILKRMEKYPYLQCQN